MEQTRRAAKYLTAKIAVGVCCRVKLTTHPDRFSYYRVVKIVHTASCWWLKLMAQPQEVSSEATWFKISLAMYEVVQYGLRILPHVEYPTYANLVIEIHALDPELAHRLRLQPSPPEYVDDYRLSPARDE